MINKIIQKKKEKKSIEVFYTDKDNKNCCPYCKKIIKNTEVFYNCKNCGNQSVSNPFYDTKWENILFKIDFLNSLRIIIIIINIIPIVILLTKFKIEILPLLIMITIGVIWFEIYTRKFIEEYKSKKQKGYIRLNQY